MQSQKSCVVTAHEVTPTHPSKIQAIKTWHADELTAPVQPLCIMSTKLMPCGQVITTMVGVEPVHADIILDHLDSHITGALQSLVFPYSNALARANG